MNNVPLSGFTLLKMERNNEVGLLLQLQNRVISGVVFHALSSQVYRFFESSKFFLKSTVDVDWHRQACPCSPG